MKMSTTVTTGSKISSINHNNRRLSDDEFKAPEHEHIIRELTPDNIIVKKEPITEAYEKIFGKAVEEYNEKQTRSDRKIDNYYKHIQKSKAYDLQREFIVTLGAKEDWDQLTREDKLEAGQKLAEYVKEFQERHPKLYVYNAVVHLDEAGAPHAHINVIPVAGGYKRGVSLKPSFKQVLKEEGFKFEGRNQLREFRNLEADKLGEKLQDMGIERYRPGTNDVKDLKQYKELMREVSAEREKIERYGVDDVTKLEKQTDEIVKKLAELPKATFGKSTKLPPGFKEKIERYLEIIVNELKNIYKKIGTLTDENKGLKKQVKDYQGISQNLEKNLTEAKNKINKTKKQVTFQSNAIKRAYNELLTDEQKLKFTKLVAEEKEKILASPRQEASQERK